MDNKLTFNSEFIPQVEWYKYSIWLERLYIFYSVLSIGVIPATALFYPAFAVRIRVRPRSHDNVSVISLT
jgi:hypothetical protein